MRGTILHEFGHLLGLKHEHVHSEAKNDSGCLQLMWNYCGNCATLESQFGPPTNAIVGNYDRYSIMGYCQLARVHNRSTTAKLSNGDQATLRLMFADLPLTIPEPIETVMKWLGFQ